MDNTLEKIYKASLKFLTPMEPEETYEVIIKEALKLVKAEFGSIFLYEDHEFRRVYVNNPAFYNIAVRKKGYTYRVFREGVPKIIDYRKIKRLPHEYEQYGINHRNDIMVPLSYQDKSIGVLSVMSVKDHQFTKKDVKVLTLLFPLATLAIRKAQLYAGIRRALEARDLFITMVTHELRTPLTTINGYIRLLQKKLSGTDTPESRWTEELSWESHRLNMLVNELLEADRIKAGRFHYHLKECSVKEIVVRALKDFSFNHPEHKILQVNNLVNGEDKVIGDFDKLLQVVNNLLDNAAKFSSPDKNINIILRPKQKNIILRVKDQGRGIHKKDLANVFDQFYRGSNPSREGMGLGLFLAKSIIAQHHGTIKVKSKEKIGTTVEIKLPRVKL